MPEYSPSTVIGDWLFEDFCKLYSSRFILKTERILVTFETHNVPVVVPMYLIQCSV